MELLDHIVILCLILSNGGFPGGTVDGNLPANAGDTGSTPGQERSRVPWGHSCLCSTATEA